MRHFDVFEAVAAINADGHYATPKQICEFSGVSRSQMYKALSYLKKIHYIITPERGQYCIEPDSFLCDAINRATKAIDDMKILARYD